MIRQINYYIPIAKERAKQMVKDRGVDYEIRLGVDGSEYVHDYFTEFFHREMTRLLKQAGLRR